MSTLVFPTQGYKTTIPSLKERFGPLALILLIHVMAFYAIYTGTLQKVAKAVMPEAITVVLITPPSQNKPAPQPREVDVSKPPPVPTAVPAIVVPPVENVVAIAPSANAPAAVAAAPAAPAPAPAATPATPRTVSNAEYLHPIQLVYPATSMRLRESGKVTLRVLINEKGLPETITVQTTSGFPRLDEAARTAVLRATFKPQIEDGRAIPVYVLIPLNFQLPS